jgi:hypothetical protein
MKKIFISISLIIFSLLLFSCNNFKYKSLQDFKRDNEANRLKEIQTILKNNNINTSNKFVLMYIDINLCSEFVKYLEIQFHTPDFEQFINTSVPTLYYSYSPDNYSSTPPELKKNVVNHILNIFPYTYQDGDFKFKNALRSELENKNLLLFPFYKENNPEYVPKVEWAIAVNMILRELLWKDYFTLSDYRRLTEYEQAELLETYMILKYSNTTINGKIIDGIKILWGYSGNKILSRPPFSNISDNTPMSQVFDLIIKNLRKIITE